MTNNRINYIDWAKFLGLCLVVYGHIPPTDNSTHVIIYSFHMPLFFFLSGVFFNLERFSVLKNVKTLLIPYYAFCLLLIIADAGLSLITTSCFDLSQFYRLLFGVLLGSSSTYAPYALVGGAGWFLIALFLVKLNAKLILSFRLYIQILIMAVELCLMACIKRMIPWIPFSLDSAILGTIFFVGGYYAKRIVVNVIPMVKKRYLLITALLLGILTILSPINKLVNVYCGEYGRSFLLFLLFGLSGTALILVLSSIIHRHNSFVSIIVKGAPFIICTHLWILDYLYLTYRVVLHRELTDPVPFMPLEKILFTIMIMLVSYVCIKFINKYCPALLGR